MEDRQFDTATVWSWVGGLTGELARLWSRERYWRRQVMRVALRDEYMVSEKK